MLFSLVNKAKRVPDSHDRAPYSILGLQPFTITEHARVRARDRDVRTRACAMHARS